MRSIGMVVFFLLASVNAFAMGKGLPEPVAGYERLDASGENALRELALYHWESLETVAISDGSPLVDVVVYGQVFEGLQVEGRRLQFASRATELCVICFDRPAPEDVVSRFDSDEAGVRLAFKAQLKIKDGIRVALGVNPKRGLIPLAHLNMKTLRGSSPSRDRAIVKGAYQYIVLEISEANPEKLVIMAYADAETVIPERIEYQRR